MYAVEFQTKISNGHIEVPAEFRAQLAGEVRVIVLKQEQPVLDSPAENLIDHLLIAPIRIEGFKPMTREEMYDRG